MKGMRQRVVAREGDKDSQVTSALPFPQQHRGGDRKRLKIKQTTTKMMVIKVGLIAILLILLFYRFVYIDKHEELYLSTIRNDCGCFYHNSKGARIAYLVLIHNERTLNESLLLVKSIAVPSSIILIHIDKKLPIEKYLSSELREFVEGGCHACGAKFLVEQKFDLKWGSWEMNAPTHWAMADLVDNPTFSKDWDVFINLSGDSMTVYTPQVLSNMLGESGPLYGFNFVTSSSCLTSLRPTNLKKDVPSYYFKRMHYESDGDFIVRYVDDNGDEKLETITIHIGSQWMVLEQTAVKYIVSSLKRDDSLASRFRDEYIRRGKVMSDETFIPTLLAHHMTLRNSLPDDSLGITAVRYERMDEDKPDPFGNIALDQHYDVPDRSSVEPSKVWGPYYLGLYDLGQIKRSGALFIRKVSREIDGNIFRVLPVVRNMDIPEIDWPTEVKVSKKVDVEQMKIHFEAMKRHLLVPKK